MISFRKSAFAALGVSALLLVGAGSALAAVQAGPPDSAPRLGLQAGTGPQAAGNGVMAGGVVMDAAADYLGMSETALATARHDGSSLAQIATGQGKSVDGLEQALVAAMKTHLDAAVAAGTITGAQAQLVLERFTAQVQTMVTSTATGPANGRGPGAGAGLGFGRGPGAGLGLGLGPCGVSS
jgi:hypothetical protein